MGKQQVTQVKRFQLRSSMLSMMWVLRVFHCVSAMIVAMAFFSSVLMGVRCGMVLVVIAVHARLQQLPHPEYYQHNTCSGADAARLKATQQSA